MKALYERYAEIRDAKGMIDADVTKKTGIAQSTFSDWKAGRSAPKVDKLFRIAAALGAHMEDLLCETSEEHDAAAV